MTNRSEVMVKSCRDSLTESIWRFNLNSADTRLSLCLAQVTRWALGSWRLQLVVMRPTEYRKGDNWAPFVSETVTLDVDAKAGLGSSHALTHPWQAKLRKLTIKKSLSYGIKTFHCTVNMVAHWKKPMSKIYIYIYVNIYCLLRLHHFQQMGQRHLQSITAVKGVCACLFTMKGCIRRQVAILISHFPTQVQKVLLFSQFHSQLLLGTTLLYRKQD